MNLSRENIYNLGDTDIFVVVDKDVVDSTLAKITRPLNIEMYV